jgi:hypothetical protein
MQKTLAADWCQCNWMGMKDRSEPHTAHCWSTPRKWDADFEVSVAEAVDRRDVNRKVLNSAAAFAGSTVLNFHFDILSHCPMNNSV